MKLSAELKAELRELDYEYGGGITTKGTKTEMIDKPVLIVGLGGTGAESLIRVKKAIYRHFNIPKKSDKPPQVEYFGIDSDDNLANIKFLDIGFSDDEFVLLDNANLTSIYKNRDTVFKQGTRDWVADNLRLQQVKHGAGGIRQAGRFLLTINSNRIVNLLTEKINRLTGGRNANDLLYVFILVGCAGGTGSGLFVDVPYIIRKIAEQRGFETENIGMIFLPDVTLSDSMIDGSAALTIKANGFAALKELDYLMNIEKNGEFFEHTYGEFEIKSNRPPYDLCHLLSAKDEMGRLMPSAKNYCMNVAAETIINFIASEESSDGQSYTINSYLSNIENNKTAFLMTHQTKQPVNYIYNTVGAASAQLPTEYLINHLTWRMFKELEPLFDKNPTVESSQRLLEAAKIDLPTLERRLTEEKPRSRDFKQYDHLVLGQRPSIIEEAIKNNMIRLKEHYAERVHSITDAFDTLLRERNNIFSQQFYDLESGPYFLLRTLSELHEASVIRRIDYIRKNDIALLREHRDSIAALELKRQMAMDKFRNRSLLSALNKKSQSQIIIKLNEDYMKALDKNLAYDAIDEIYENISGMLIKYSNEVVDTFCELLTALKELFDKFENPENHSRDSSEAFTIELIDAKSFCETILALTEGVEGGDQSLAIDYKASLMHLLRKILLEDSWTPNLNHRIIENLNSFVTSQFQNVMHKSLDYYLIMLAKANDVSENDYIEKKIENLQEQGKVMFPMNHIPNAMGIEFPPYTYLSSPANAPQIRSVAREMTGRASNIKYSRITNRLYMLNLKIAVALYCYKELNEYESVYEVSLNRIAGLHLYESSEKNWRNLPSPNYDKLWTAEHENPRERIKNNKTRAVFDRAKELGLIRLDEGRNRYVCYYGEPVDYNARFGEIEAGAVNRTFSAPQARACIHEINSFLSNGGEREVYQTPLFDTEFIIEENRADDEYAKGVFIYMPALNERIAEEIILREKVTALKNKLESIDKSEVKYSHFAHALYMGVISRWRKAYKYSVDDVDYNLYIMDNINERHVEYNVYQEYLKLDEATTTYLRRKAQDIENSYSDEEYAKLMDVIEGYIKICTDKLEQMEEEPSYDERDETLKKLFYREMREVFAKEKVALL